jgi:nitrite reductase/ring-hydroxylating ferredoxin subunit
MPRKHGEPAIAPLPSPYPEGWYFVAHVRDVRKKDFVQKTWMGEGVVVWCDDEDRVCLAEAICPHLGSFLGPTAGGRISDGRIVCPFHGFEFDTTGKCVHTPFAAPPRSARLRVFPTRVICGLIFGWWGLDGREPQWELPSEEPDQSGWCDLRIRTLRFRGHPQETTENSVDLAHLRYVHGYDNVGRVDPLSVDGAYLRSRFDFIRTREIAGILKMTFALAADVHVYGLGYSLVAVHERSIGMDMRIWILATPTNGEYIDYTLACQVRELRSPKSWIFGLGFLPVKMRAPLLNRFMSAQQADDVLQDVEIWGRKKFVSQPRLCRSDGEVRAFRAYCEQFYPENGG